MNTMGGNARKVCFSNFTVPLSSSSFLHQRSTGALGWSDRL